MNDEITMEKLPSFGGDGGGSPLFWRGWGRFYLIIMLLLVVSSIKAQSTEGTDFWLTFGKSGNATYNISDLQIRIVSGDSPTAGTIKFTKLGSEVPFNISAQQVFTHTLDNTQKEAVYNTSMGVSNRSIHITSNEPITVYALNQSQKYTDATNILPLTALGTDYYQISYTPYGSASDAYAVVATEDNTKIYHEGSEAATLQAGEVYYRIANTDMTGNHITTTSPVAFFAVNQLVRIPTSTSTGDCLMQQLAAVNTWGRRFFVPVADLTLLPTYPDTKNRVRIVASQNGTTLTTQPVNVTLITDSGGQSPLTKSLNAGDFFELDVTLNNKGCYFETNKPVGVCTYLPSMDYNNKSFSDPAQGWLPSIEQAMPIALIAPFVPSGNTNLDSHKALIITKTVTKNNTKVSIGGGTLTSLSGGNWYDNTAAGWSFYNMPLTNKTASYYFTNAEGLIVMGYGTGGMESYYYLAFSAMRNLAAAFTANGISYIELSDHLFCEHDITFVANIQGIDPAPGSLNWYINNVHQPALTDRLTWNQNFAIGSYAIKMNVLFDNGTTETHEGTLKIGAAISVSAAPTTGGTVTGDGCYEAGETVNLTATPNVGYDFENWTENGTEVSTNPSYSFTAATDRTLIANFLGADREIILLAKPPTGGTVTGAGIYPYGEFITIDATSNSGYNFVNWTENGVEVSRDPSYPFTVENNRILTANFSLVTYDVLLSANPLAGGIVFGSGSYPYGTAITASAIPNPGYKFVNWTENGIETSKNPAYSFTVVKSYALVANFEKIQYEVIAEVDEKYGYTTGSGMYDADATASVAVFGSCYRFKNWTIGDSIVSVLNPYKFKVTDNVTLVANFHEALDFDTYCAVIWNNTLMLNLQKLRADGYSVIGCEWYKNDVKENNTRTIDDFSYSAGPKATDLLEPTPTYYSFRLITKNRGELCSTSKFINYYLASPASNDNLWGHPNPVTSGMPFTVENVVENDEIRIFNQYGVCVHTDIAAGETITLTLHVEAGVYVIWANEKHVKVVVIK